MLFEYLSFSLNLKDGSQAHCAEASAEAKLYVSIPPTAWNIPVLWFATLLRVRQKT